MLAVVFILFLILFATKHFYEEKEDSTHVVIANLANQEIILEVADNNFLRRLGLSGRDYMDENYGMIFVYDYEIEGLSFWMKDTLIPLDMIFLNKNFEVVHIIENVPICYEEPCSQYTYEGSAKYVLELNAGWVENHGVELGEVLELKGLDQFDS